MSQLSQPFEDVLFTTVDNGPFFIDELFQRKFASPAPEHGVPVVGFYRKSWEHFIPVCYINVLPYDEVLLVGGVMTDGRAFGHMSNGLPEKITASGGMYYHLLRFVFDKFANHCEAYFGYSGDQRGYKVGIQAGFEPTAHKHLIVRFPKPLSEEKKKHLIEKIHAVGPF